MNHVFKKTWCSHEKLTDIQEWDIVIEIHKETVFGIPTHCDIFLIYLHVCEIFNQSSTLYICILPKFDQGSTSKWLGIDVV